MVTDAVCSEFEAVLPSMCSCSPTIGNTGLIAQCSIAADIGAVSLPSAGVSVKIESCVSSAYVSISVLQLNRQWYTYASDSMNQQYTFGVPGISAGIDLGFPSAVAGLPLTTVLCGSLSSATLRVLADACGTLSAPLVDSYQ